MIRILFILVALLMLVGGVVGGLYYWGIDPMAKLGIHLGKTPDVAKVEVAPVLPSYVDFGQLLVPVIQDHEVKHQADMILRLRVAPNKKEAVAQLLPRLQAGYLEDMMDFLPMSLRDSSDLDLPAIRRRLLAVSERIAGHGAIIDVVVENSEVK